jgi:hypothetical protein
MTAVGEAWQWVHAEEDRVESHEWRGEARELALAEGRLQRAEAELAAAQAYVQKVAARRIAEQGVTA